MRRVHVPHLSSGKVVLDAAQSRHVRTVLRAQIGQMLEIFDDTGQFGQGEIEQLEPLIIVNVPTLIKSPGRGTLTVATALPKGDRADWMVEKLSEIGVDWLIPLRTARSVVHPEGQKINRWERIAIEAAKQSRRPGVMKIDPLTSLGDFLLSGNARSMLLLTTQGDATAISEARLEREEMTLVIGPEGGWTDAETADMLARGLTPVTLGPTILRIETAAILGAGLIRLLQAKEMP